MKWFGNLKQCNCWACKNVRGGGDYQPCHKSMQSAISSPPKELSGKSFEDFEQWVKSTGHYPKLMLIHGERLLIKEDGQYKILAIQLAYEAWTI